MNEIMIFASLSQLSRHFHFLVFRPVACCLYLFHHHFPFLFLPPSLPFSLLTSGCFSLLLFLQISANGLTVENVEGVGRPLCSRSGETTRITFLMEFGALPSLQPIAVDSSLDVQVVL
jgi:hypothetical protein